MERLQDLNARSREILRHIVDAYVETGEPLGSRTLSRLMGMSLSPATIRNVMADLTEAGLLFAPHTSAGRLPTDAGLRLFVDGILEIGDVSDDERKAIEGQCGSAGRTYAEVLEEATSMLSGLSSCAGLVVAPKADRALRHIEFINLAPGRALVVMVNQDGVVENRVVDVPLGVPAGTFVTASNYLMSHVVGRTLSEARADILTDIEQRKAELDELTAKLVEAGVATLAGSTAPDSGTFIVKGQSRLLTDVQGVAGLDRIRRLFESLETKETMLKMLEATQSADGVQIFIGAENSLFSHTGCSMVIAPYTDGQERIVGAIGVIGPTRINYARIIPMVDYTAKVIGQILWNKQHTSDVA